MKICIVLIMTYMPFLISAQTKSVLYLFNNLLDELSEQKMIQTCEKHDGKRIPNLENEKVGATFSFPDGTNIYVRMDSISPDKKTPIIKVYTKEHKKQIEYVLFQSQFIKEGKEYVRVHKYGSKQVICFLSGDKKSKDTIINFSLRYNK